MPTPEDNIKTLREAIKLKLESNELDKASRAISEESLRNLDQKNASEAEYRLEIDSAVDEVLGQTIPRARNRRRCPGCARRSSHRQAT